jgi:hypothetical protein
LALAVPWDRQPTESAEAYRAFVLYRSMPAKVRAYDKVGLSHSLVRRWAARFRWVTRVAEWEAWLVESQAELNETGQIAFRRKTVEFALTGLNKAKLAAAQLNETKLSAGEAVELASASVRLGRAALGFAEGPARATTDAPGLSVSFAPAWLTLNQAKSNQIEPVVQVGEQVLGETPAALRRTRLVDSIVDCPEDKGPIGASVGGGSLLLPMESTSPSASQAPPEPAPAPEPLPGDKKDKIPLPKTKDRPYVTRCRKHGNGCYYGGHN